MKLRTLLINLSCTLTNAAERIHYPDPVHPIGWRDHLRWNLQGIFDRLFALAYDGSQEELDAVYRAELPIRHMSPRQRALISGARCEYDAICIHCAWQGTLDQAPADNCPICGRAIYLREFEPPAPLEKLKLNWIFE